MAEYNNPATNKEPQPKGKGNDVTDLVKQDLEARAETGKKKYGERLTSNNGRNALVDAYQEALDLALYLRQEIDEQNLTESMLRELLALIHRDGGHHTEAVGIKQSVIDAADKINNWKE